MSRCFEFKRWSITWRLSFLFAMSSGVLIAVMGVYLYRASDAELDREIRGFCEARWSGR